MSAEDALAVRVPVLAVAVAATAAVLAYETLRAISAALVRRDKFWPSGQ